MKDSQIEEAARNFVERFGENAPAEAQRRANELQAAGKRTGYETWTKILQRVTLLLNADTTGRPN